MKLNKISRAIVGALLVAGATGAAAQANNHVQLYGSVNQFITKDQVGSTPSVTRMDSESSRFGLRGSENLGNGLRARFIVETGVRSDDPQAAPTFLGNRESKAGLVTEHFSVDLGRGKHALMTLIDKHNPFLIPYTFGVLDTHNVQGLRTSNTVFLAAKPIKGFNVQYEHGFSEVTGRDPVQVVRADYDSNQFSLGVVKYEDVNNRNKSEMVAGQLRPSKETTLYGMYSRDTTTGQESTGKTVALAQKLTPVLTAMASFGQREGFNANKAVNLGLTYDFSKRTALHARYLDANYVADARDRKQVSLGLSHSF